MTDTLPREHARFAAALQAAIAARGVTLSWLHKRLRDRGNPVSMASLSYWRSGARQPEGAQSLSAVNDIETLLGLARGELARLIGPTVRLGPVAPPQLPFEEEQIRREVEETMAVLAAPPQDTLRDLSTHMVADIGADGGVTRCVTRGLVQSTKGSLRELSLIDVAPTKSDLVPEVVDVIGGRITREYSHPGGLVSGVVLELDDPITVGRTALFEFTEHYPPGYPARQELWHATARPSQELLLWARFLPDAVPDWCEQYVEMEDDDSSWPREVSSNAVHVARYGFGPGILGIRWGFDGFS